MINLFICIICGEAYIGEEAPTNCPFCGAHKNYMIKSKSLKANFDLQLDAKDKANAEHALQVEISNSAFYFSAAKKTDELSGKIMFEALGKIEAKHAEIWAKILKISNFSSGNDQGHLKNEENLSEAHNREDVAIKFYTKAAGESKDARLKRIFLALIEIENDHLVLTESEKK